MQSVVRGLTDVRSAQRWDFDYHNPAYTKVVESLGQCYPTLRFGDIITLLTDMGAFSLYRTEFFVDDGIPFLRVQNVQEYGVDLTKDTKCISLAYHEQLQKSQLQPNDLLLTTKAVIGVAAVVEDSLGECNMSQNLVRIRVAEGINPHYLAAFLNSQLGRIQTVTAATGPNQQYLNFERIRNLRITLPPRPVQDRIAQVMQKTYATRREKLAEADALLDEIDEHVLGRLGIALGEHSRKKFLVVKLSHLIGRRFDVGPYANEFDMQGNLPFPWVELQALAELPRAAKTASKKPDTEYLYIGMPDVDDVMAEVNIQRLVGREIKANKTVFRGGDVVFARIEPCIYNRKIALIPYEVDEVLGSTELLVVRARQDVVPEFLLWILRSELIQRQIAGRMTGTTGRRRLPPRAFAGLKVPKVPVELQREIAEQATERRDRAKDLQQEAEAVIAEAKAHVERLILGQE